MLDRVRRRAWGLSGRLIASYILVTLVVVVLVEALVLGFLVPRLVNGGQLQAQVDATAQSYVQELAQRYPGGVPAGTVLGDPGQPAQPGTVANSAPDGTLLVPAFTGPIHSNQGVTAVVAVAGDGTVVASSAPSRYPPGRAAASELPVQAAMAMSGGPLYIKGGSPPTPYGNVLFWVVGPEGRAGTGKPPASAEEEAKLAMEGVKQVLQSQGMGMDDLVSVQVYCTDFALYDKFNGVYRTYCHEHFPARAFLGVASLIRGAHFEITGVAVKRAK